MLGLAAVDWAGDFEQDSAKPGLTQNHREASSGGREVLTPLKAVGKPWAAVMSLGEKKKDGCGPAQVQRRAPGEREPVW